ncbi:putative F-box protein At1g30920 [Miscanthus floridulus]|uniref:putative F-box protein At1g30920 n=1 Tax=Miscanthus floridulus TaxID=154761 RepID=UPI0034586752
MVRVRARSKTSVIPRKKKHDGGVSLPVYMVFDVLSRVPAKALCWFRRVCKAWRALISDPAFVAAQRSCAGPHLVGVFYRSSSRPEVWVMDMAGNVVRVFQVRLLLGKHGDSTDALSVLQQATTRPNNLIVDARTGLMIIDPAAGHACTVDVRHAAPSGALLAFRPATLCGAFKVMVVYFKDYLPPQICKVATIVDGGAEPLRWRQMSSPPFATSWWHESSVTVKGVVYCLPQAFCMLHRIAAFVFESEEWKTINGPALGIQRETRYAELIELKGTLGLVQFLRQPSDDDHSYAIVWLLIDFNKSVWIMECTIQMPGTWGSTKLLGSLDDGTILLLVSQTKQNKAGYDDS